MAEVGTRSKSSDPRAKGEVEVQQALVENDGIPDEGTVQGTVLL